MRKLAERLAEAGPFYLANLRRLLGPAFAGTELVPPTQAVDRHRHHRPRRARRSSCAPGPPPTPTPTSPCSTPPPAPCSPAISCSWSACRWSTAACSAGSPCWTSWSGCRPRASCPGHGPASAPWPEALAAERRYLERCATPCARRCGGTGPWIRPLTRCRCRRASAGCSRTENHPRNVTASFTELEWE